MLRKKSINFGPIAVYEGVQYSFYTHLFFNAPAVKALVVKLLSEWGTYVQKAAAGMKLIPATIDLPRGKCLVDVQAKHEQKVHFSLPAYQLHTGSRPGLSYD